MRVIAVIPAYREAGRIGAVVRGLLPQVAAVVVVDDGSPDETAAEAADAGAIVLRHALNRDQGAALRTGNEAALRLGAEVVVHFDADGQHDSADLPVLLYPIARGEADVVLGSRFLGVSSVGMPLTRRLFLRLARLMSRVLLGTPPGLTDPQSGLRAMTADAVRRLDFRQDRKAHCSEILMLLAKSGLRWREVPIRVIYTKDTLSKGQKTLDAFKVFWQIIVGSLE
jgi:glycosyltransferase involved in cell wall biosynthesis